MQANLKYMYVWTRFSPPANLNCVGFLTGRRKRFIFPQNNDETPQNFEIRQEKIRATFHLIKS